MTLEINEKSTIATLGTLMTDARVMGMETPIARLREKAANPKLTEGLEFKHYAEAIELRFKAAQKIFKERISPHARLNLSEQDKNTLQIAVSDMEKQIMLALASVQEMKKLLAADHEKKVRDGTYREPGSTSNSEVTTSPPERESSSKPTSEQGLLDEVQRSIRSELDTAKKAGKFVVVESPWSADYSGTLENDLSLALTRVKIGLGSIKDNCYILTNLTTPETPKNPDGSVRRGV